MSKKRKRGPVAPVASDKFSVGDNLSVIVTALLASCIFLLYGTFSIGPAWAAHEGQGVHGTYLVTGKQCNKSCDWIGTFTPAMGGEVKTDVQLGGGGQVVGIGSHVPAVDTGASGTVYPVGGGSRWIWSLIAMAIGGCGVLVTLVISFLYSGLRRGRR
jgi:hypothetical protein